MGIKAECVFRLRGWSGRKNARHHFGQRLSKALWTDFPTRRCFTVPMTHDQTFRFKLKLYRILNVCTTKGIFLLTAARGQMEQVSERGVFFKNQLLKRVFMQERISSKKSFHSWCTCRHTKKWCAAQDAAVNNYNAVHTPFSVGLASSQQRGKAACR